MMTTREVIAYLKQVEDDERLYYPTATVVENAPLALVQQSLETARDVLRRVLGPDAPPKPNRKFENDQILKRAGWTLAYKVKGRRYWHDVIDQSIVLDEVRAVELVQQRIKDAEKDKGQ